MMTCTRITTVEYYESMACQIMREAGLITPSTTLDKTAAAYARKAVGKEYKEGNPSYEIAYTEAYDQALRTIQKEHSEGRDQVAYYTDNGAGESHGVWWTRSLLADPSRPCTRGSIPSPFRLCADGSEVDGRILRDLAQGRDPETKNHLVRQSATGKRSAGYDLQFAAPKSVSVLAAFAEPELRDKILAAHDRAVRRAMDYAFDAGLIVTRMGHAGKTRSPIEEAAAATYRHFTSRAQDPQLHSHMVLLNLAVRQDRKTGGIDNRDILRNAGGIAALYRSELASELRRELNIEVIRSGRNFEVAGIPETVLELFSKRRVQIEKAARKDGFNTATSRGAAQVAAFETRAAKDKDISLVALEERWVRELDHAGWTSEALFEIARVEGARIRRERDSKRLSHDARLAQLALTGVTAATQTEAVLEQRHLLRHVAESLQCEASADQVLAAVEGLISRGQVVRLEQTKLGEPAYSTIELIDAEKAMLRNAFARQGERTFVSPTSLDRVLADRLTLREEQKAAVRHALNRDGVVVVEGAAGSGKSYAMASVAAAARDAGAEVWTIAPSWKAVDVIRTDTETADEMARAVAGFLNRVRSNEINICQNTVILTDEAGMIGVKDMAALVEVAGQAGAKLVLVGDTRQLAPVVAGAPMRALVKALGTSRMGEIQRQKGRTDEEGQWMRAASMDFARGETTVALEAYDRAGAITWAEDRDAALAALVRDYVTDRQQAPAKIHVVLTGWNVDVGDINRRVREALIVQGMLPMDRDVEISAISRGGGRPITLALAPNDDIIFGETVEVAGHTLRNADLARIEDIDQAKDGNAILTFRLAKNGVVIKANMSELVGFREKVEAKVPKLQHAYAMTIHAAQGVTVDQCYVANLRGMQSQNTYVAMTRHRECVRLYVDTSRVRDQIEARRPGVAPKDRGVSGKVEQAPEIGLAEVRKALFEEATASGIKANPSDFLPESTSLRNWVKEPSTDLRMKSPFHSKRRPIISVQSPAFPVSSHQTRDALHERMAARTGAPVAYPVPNRPDARSAWVNKQEPAAPQVPEFSLSPAERQTMLARMRRAWHRIGQDGTPNAYLLQVLKIAREVLDRFRTDIRTTRYGRAAFAHRNLEGQIVGFKVEGTVDTPEYENSIFRDNHGMEKIFSQLGDVTAPVRIYVTKSTVEGLSILQADGVPSRALIVSFDGQPSAAALDRFRELVRRYPDAVVHVAMDNGAAGQSFGENVKAHIRENYGSKARVVDRRPEENFETWNAQLRGWTVEDETRLRATQKTEMKATVVVRKFGSDHARSVRYSGP